MRVSRDVNYNAEQNYGDPLTYLLATKKSKQHARSTGMLGRWGGRGKESARIVFVCVPVCVCVCVRVCACLCVCFKPFRVLQCTLLTKDRFSCPLRFALPVEVLLASWASLQQMGCNRCLYMYHVQLDACNDRLKARVRASESLP